MLEAKPVPMPLCPLQFSHGQLWDRAQAPTVRDRRPSVWAMARLASLDLMPFNNECRVNISAHVCRREVSCSKWYPHLLRVACSLIFLVPMLQLLGCLELDPSIPFDAM